MKTASLLFAGLLLAAAPAWADDAADVRAFTASYDRAYLAGDAKAVEALLAADYRVVVEGLVKDRAAALAEFAAKDRPTLTAMSSTVDRVHVTGDLAVAVGRIDWANSSKKGGEHFTMVLRRETGRWQVVDEHLSDVAKDAAP